MDVASIADKRTGVYLNKAKCRYEAWAVDPTTNKAVLLGWIDAGLVREFPEAKQIWERHVWSRFLQKVLPYQ